MEAAPGEGFEGGYDVKLRRRRARRIHAAFQEDAITITDAESGATVADIPVGDIAGVLVGRPRYRKGRKGGGYVVLSLRTGGIVRILPFAPAYRDWADVAPDLERARNAENVRRYRLFVRRLVDAAVERLVPLTGGDPAPLNEPLQVGTMCMGIGVFIMAVFAFFIGETVPVLFGAAFFAIGAGLFALGRARLPKPIGHDAAALEPLMPGKP